MFIGYYELENEQYNNIYYKNKLGYNKMILSSKECTYEYMAKKAKSRMERVRKW